MRKFLFFLLSMFLTFNSNSQEVTDQLDIDANYLEDQFYAGLAYNYLANRPVGVIQRNFSYNLQFGFIKDLPLNEKRNFGFGIGLGYATNSYYSNLRAISTNGEISYEIPEVDFDRSKLETHALEIPLEIRWRTSNALDYRFWRIYAGGRINYNFLRKSKYKSEGVKDVFTNENISQFNYGLTLSFGYNTFNLHAYYALNPILENASLNGEPIKMHPLRIGLIFYIL